MSVVDKIARFLEQASTAAGFKTRENTRQSVYAASEHLRAALRILTDRHEWRVALLTLDCLNALMDKHAAVREAGWDASGAVRAREVSAEVRAALVLKIEGTDRSVAGTAAR